VRNVSLVREGEGRSFGKDVKSKGSLEQRQGGLIVGISK